MTIINRFDARLVSQGRRALGYRQEQVMRFIFGYRARHGREPSYGRIRDELDIEKGNISRIVRSLERLGHLNSVHNNNNRPATQCVAAGGSPCRQKKG